MNTVRNIAVISNIQTSGVRGGAEIFHQKLVDSLAKYVPNVELIEIPCCEYTYEDILRSYESCYSLDLSRFDGVITSKAPTFAVTHPNHVCYLMHTVRVFYDMFEEAGSSAEQRAQRKLIFRMDKELLSAPRTKKVYTIGHEVSERLQKYIGIQSTPLHPGITSENFYSGITGDYIYMPGRLHKWKRVDLAVRAMKYVTSPLKLKIAGTGDMLEELKMLAGGDNRIEFLGYVDDAGMKSLYADALAVAFMPLREDYGYILHEAFKSEKAVITCCDSGEPTRFIDHGVNGFVAEPDPQAIAEYFDLLYRQKERAAEMGKAGKDSIAHISWELVAQKLLEELERK